MNPSHNPYGRIPEFFLEQCTQLGLPLDAVIEDTAGFVAAVLALSCDVDKVRMRLYLESHNGSYNYLACYLQAITGLTHTDSGRVANEVLTGLINAGIPDTYRDVRMVKNNSKNI